MVVAFDWIDRPRLRRRSLRLFLVSWSVIGGCEAIVATEGSRKPELRTPDSMWSVHDATEYSIINNQYYICSSDCWETTCFKQVHRRLRPSGHVLVIRYFDTTVQTVCTAHLVLSEFTLSVLTRTLSRSPRDSEHCVHGVL
ncbi:hypothetical protein PF005_g30573 [Phytophthora fragariae]|uniref:Uncharacterized protein n=1 Tax=Phytophthora fragariae TaxID=53985 RepID=A0A6A3DRS9_9STRA|nr:hypothetical protein PF003_g34725 [Phytophthora fragariae]KAE8921130.1 hypothetical protein PF009_g28584 [Phytophthora fragariae]KAE8961905.1 hypothetical protein PF011_g29577 [Phytophthora fragariae]KAE9060474.1 hypothetical protein PF010_g30202 [Phytophthora fragariae]KAE9067141.1 hypothetical protein PF007_g28183 [Phytophthora fragariae]